MLRDGELTVKHAQYNDSGAYECVARTNKARAEAFTDLVVRGQYQQNVVNEETFGSSQRVEMLHDNKLKATSVDTITTIKLSLLGWLGFCVY